MATSKLNIILFLLITIVGISCSEFIEESISKKMLKIISPADSARTTNYTQTFWWEEIEGALEYRLQIVKNRYDSVPEFRLDTTISKNKFTVTLSPGKYQWKVSALNGSSETDSVTIQTLRVDSVGIEGQEIVLNLPSNKSYTQNTVVNFTWEKLPGALEYHFELSYSGSFSLAGKLVDTLITANDFEYSVAKDSTFYWRVTGKRKDVFSNTSEVRSFVVDNQAPPQIAPSLPEDKAEKTLPVTLSWTAPSDKALSYYKVYVYKDKNGTQTFSTSYPYSTKSTTNPLATNYKFNKSSAVNDTIFWEIRAVDKAENEGPKGTLRSVIVK